jgi:hypothetical protein
VKPGIPNAKNNQFFCIKAGTPVVWMSSNKNNGFMVSFGTDSPFDPDDPIMGGGKKQVRTKASTPGCYKYDAGAFRSGQQVRVSHSALTYIEMGGNDFADSVFRRHGSHL